MWKLLLCFLLLVVTLAGNAQHETFPFGAIGVKELNARFEKDTSANAVIIREFGRAEIDNSNNHNLLFTYHVTLKILKKEGLDLANVEIILDKRKDAAEKVLYVKASGYNIENGLVQETRLVQKNVFSSGDENYDYRKFTIPNARVGSVIEYEYQVESPFFGMNFWPWRFQGAVPKLSSEYWATVPANYRYNIALRGMLPLKRNENEVLKDYFTPGGGMKADCVRYKWSMEDVPAFVEEDYMTSKRNFLSAIHFELIQIEYFDGRKNKVTKEWADVDQELKTYEKFGVQLRRGKEIAGAQLSEIMVSTADSQERARRVFEFVREWYKWNENFGFYSENGIRRAFEGREGNVGDINLTLVAALRFAGYQADPMILSTRKHGTPTDLFPVLSEFNYVVAKLDLSGKSYLLDATDDFLPFGVLPERCLNGQGRVFPKGSSYWHDIKPADRFRRISALTLKLAPDGKLTGTIQNTYTGYKAAQVRSEIYSEPGPEAYLKKRMKTFPGEVTNISYSNMELFSKPLVEKFEITMDFADFANGAVLMVNPYVQGHLSRNPFKASERIYPVDYGAPLDETDVITIELPADVEVDELPEKVGLSLPANGGRFLYSAKLEGNVLSVNSAFSISRTIFSSNEYHYLKEMYNQAIRAYSMDIILKKKTGN